jgi:hypothetical protein
MNSSDLASNQPVPEQPTENDLRFLYEQARRCFESGAWEALGSTSLYLDLKVGSWHEVCAQLLNNGKARMLLLFPGRLNMLDPQLAGTAEPPAGTILVGLFDEDQSPPELIAEARAHGWPTALWPIPAFRVITPQGWVELDRREARVVALAFAAILGYASSGGGAPDAEDAGDLILPGGVRGRHRARKAPGQEGGLQQPFVSVARFDLYDGVDTTFTLSSERRDLYERIRKQALFCSEPKEPLTGVGHSIPLVVISGTEEEAKLVSERLRVAEPIGLVFGETNGVLAMILCGRKESYVLMEADGSQREQVMVWWHNRKASSGAHAIVITDTMPERTGWAPKTVHAIFECRSADG